MKIAYLILAHRHPHQVERLIAKLDGPDSSFCVHVDQKSDLQPFSSAVGSRANVFFLQDRQRIKVFWRGFSIVRATLNLMQQALQSKADYYVLLSEGCYPIKSSSYIRDFLDRSPLEYIHYFKLSDRPDWAADKIRKFHFWDSNLVNLRTGFVRTRKFYRRMRSRTVDRLPDRRPPGGLEPYGGSGWWMLSEQCVKYVVNHVRDHPETLGFYRYTDAPDEMMFQTIILNSYLRSRCVNFEAQGDPDALAGLRDGGPWSVCYNLRYLVWDRSRANVIGSPAILDERDFDALTGSECLFARKFDPVLSADLMCRLDNPLPDQGRRRAMASA